MSSKISVILEGNHHCSNFRVTLDQIGKPYDVYGDSELKSLNYTPNQLTASLINKGTEVIISAGQYGEHIVKNLNIPVIFVKRSKFAFAVAVKEAKKYSNNIAIIGRRGVFYDAAMQFKSMFNENIIVECFESEAEIPKILEYIKSCGVNVLITGSRGRKHAIQYGFRCISVPFEQDDILAAIKEAEHTLRYIESRVENTRILKAIQNHVTEGVIAVDNNGIITEINQLALNLSNTAKENMIGKNIKDTFYSPITLMNEYNYRRSFEGEIITINGKTISLSLSPIIVSEEHQTILLIFSLAEHVQKQERDLRAKLYTKGHIAGYSFDKIIAASPSTLKTIEDAKKYSTVDSSVLITGPSGSGKEVFAQSIHNASKRQHNPFVVINCGALPETLLESILFGYEKGSYTGALKEGKKGLFEVAHGGTVFLDEVSEMSLSLQTRFLRVLQEKEVTPIGSDRVIPIDVRVIAATNRDMNKMVSEGGFREDLFYRLAVLWLNIQPLNMRKEDIPFLIEHFTLTKYKELNLKKPIFSDEVISYLSSLDYPGNIRQLGNIIERIMVLCQDSYATLDMVQKIITPNSAMQIIVSPTLSESEYDVITRLLKSNNGNRLQTAKALNISPTTLWRRMKKYNLQ